MKQCGADTLQIEKFIEILKGSCNFNEAFLKSETARTKIHWCMLYATFK